MAALALLVADAHAGSRELLVSDRGTNRVLRYDLDSGAFLAELVGPGNPLSGNELNTPVAMALSPTGTLLVASLGGNAPNDGRIVEYDVITGEFLGDFASGLSLPNDILVYKNQVFVSSLGGVSGFDGEIIYRFNADGSTAGVLGSGTGPFGRSGLAAGADGKLYVGSFFDGRVLRFDLDTGLPDGSDPTGTFGSLAPTGVFTGYLAFDNNEDLLAVGLGSFNVTKLDGQSGANLGEFISASAGLFFPSDIVPLELEGQVLVTSIGNDDPNNGLPLGFGYISKFDLGTGAAISPFFIAGTGGLEQPTALLVLSRLLGDVNGDGFVGQDDLNIILGSWGQHVPSGAVADLSRDGFVGQDDLNFVLSQWGQGTLPTLRTAAVPEASSLLFISTACMCLLASCRHRQRRGCTN